MATRLAVAALVLASLALLAALLRPGSERGAGAAPAGRSELAALAARVAALEERQAEIGSELARATLVPAAPLRESSGESDPLVAELLERVAELERSAAARDARDLSMQFMGSRGAQATASEEREDELRELRSEVSAAIEAARDPAASDATLIQSLRFLQGNHLPDGSDARLQALDEVLALAARSIDGETRADVWRHLNGLTDARLRRPLLDALVFDASASVREEAAQTLGSFLPDREVEAALRAAADGDVNAMVRRQASESLGDDGQ